MTESKTGWSKISVATTVIVALLAFMAGDFANFRSDDRRVLDREFSEVQKQSQKVLIDIRLLANQARGEGKAAKDDLSRFKVNLTSLHQSAKEVSQRAPDVEIEFRAYATAMVKLQKSAVMMTGPLDAAPFVENVSQFIKAQDDFNSKVQSVQNKYF